MDDPPAPRGRPTRTGAAGAVRRRDLLTGVAVGGMGILGGCSSGSDPGTGAGDTVEGVAWETTVEGHIDDAEFVTPGGTLGTLAFDVGFVRHPETRERTFVLAEAVEETPDTVSITLRDGLEWSNGDPLTAADIGRWTYMFRTGSSWFAPVPEIRTGDRRPRSPWEAITGVEWDGPTLTVTGRFETMESPLPLLNTYLGSRPGTYYDDLWSDFRRAYDDVPWEDEATRAAVADLVDENIWGIERDRLPGGAVRLEAGDGGGVEAAFSGLWYPYRRRGDRLFFTVNGAHPFADRVNFDEVVWTFRRGQDAAIRDVSSGAIDGAMQPHVTEAALDGLPPAVESFDGPARDVVTLVLNQTANHLWRRDARAALQYAIDRPRLREDVGLVTVDAIEVPGADLQSGRWAPADLRERLRSYEHDPDRAASLLAGAGFRRTGEQWETPAGERFELELLTDEPSPTVELAVRDQLEAFGIDTSVHPVEAGTYRTRLDQRYFAATRGRIRSPNATGLRRTRTADLVEAVRRGDGFPESGYLEREVRAAVGSRPDLEWAPDTRDAPVADRRLAFDSLESLRAVVVEAPPLGDPDGELREWPYLYHAARATSAPDTADRIDHARICTWIYNYQVPVVELLSRGPRIFHRTDGWDVPDRDDPVWRYARETLHPGGLWAALATGQIAAA